jgi:hypothetical protein
MDKPLAELLQELKEVAKCGPPCLRALNLDDAAFEKKGQCLKNLYRII